MIPGGFWRETWERSGFRFKEADSCPDLWTGDRSPVSHCPYPNARNRLTASGSMDTRSRRRPRFLRARLLSASLRSRVREDPHHPGPLLPTTPSPSPGEEGEQPPKTTRARETSQTAPAGFPSPGEGDGVVGRGAGVRVLGGGTLRQQSERLQRPRARRAYAFPSNIASVGSVSGPFSVHTA